MHDAGPPNTHTPNPALKKINTCDIGADVDVCLDVSAFMFAGRNYENPCHADAAGVSLLIHRPCEVTLEE
jgi:hypothetical protein